MNIKLNKRLTTISVFIENNSKVIDIGCDHGLLGIYLVLNKYISKMISSDINEMPLNKAKENIKKYNLEDKIETRLGDGIQCIDENIDTIIISGIGGLTINDILKDIKKHPYIKKIVISPNNEFVQTRKIISKLGFYLDKESIISENGKYYLISCYIRGNSKKTDYFFGKLDFNNIDVCNYYKMLGEKNAKILSNLGKKYILKKIKLKYINYIINRKIINKCKISK